METVWTPLSFIEREFNKLGMLLWDKQKTDVPRYDEIKAARQALAWALDPQVSMSPFDFIAASAAETRSAETAKTGSVEDEGAVPPVEAGDAPNPPKG